MFFITKQGICITFYAGQTRDFKGLNALSKKEASITKAIEYQVKIMEAGRFEIEIVGCHLADGPFNAPSDWIKPLKK
jgi:hypothetical protein